MRVCCVSLKLKWEIAKWKILGFGFQRCSCWQRFYELIGVYR